MHKERCALTHYMLKGMMPNLKAGVTPLRLLTKGLQAMDPVRSPGSIGSLKSVFSAGHPREDLLVFQEAGGSCPARFSELNMVGTRRER